MACSDKVHVQSRDRIALLVLVLNNVYRDKLAFSSLFLNRLMLRIKSFLAYQRIRSHTAQKLFLKKFKWLLLQNLDKNWVGASGGMVRISYKNW